MSLVVAIAEAVAKGSGGDPDFYANNPSVIPAACAYGVVAVLISVWCWWMFRRPR